MEDINIINHNLEHEGMYEDDDGFYSELRRQILKLTADDDDEDFLENRLSRSVSTCQRRSSRLQGNFCCAFQPGDYFSWRESTDHANNNNSVPTWLVNLWRNGHGTGVFIPQIIKARRRYKPGRMNFERSRMTSKQLQIKKQF